MQRLTTAQVTVHNGKDAAEVPVLFLPADNIAHGAVQQLRLTHRTVPHLEVAQAADETVAYPHNKAILSLVQVTQHQATVGLQALSTAKGFGMHEAAVAIDLQQLFLAVPQAAHTVPHKKGQINLNVSSGAKKIQSQLFVFSRESKLYVIYVSGCSVSVIGKRCPRADVGCPVQINAHSELTQLRDAVVDQRHVLIIPSK